jgi:hypothetical protein
MQKEQRTEGGGPLLFYQESGWGEPDVLPTPNRLKGQRSGGGAGSVSLEFQTFLLGVVELTALGKIGSAQKEKS